jgi:hypothetical protein
VRSLVIVTIVAACLAACGGEEPPAPAPTGIPEGKVEFERLLPDGVAGSHDHEEFLVIRDATAFDTLWLEAMDGRGTAPRVDFRERMVLAALLGPCDGPGHAVSIGRVERVGDELVVTVAVRRPSGEPRPGRTNPYSFVTVPATSLPVTWRTVDGARPSLENPRTEGDDPR